MGAVSARLAGLFIVAWASLAHAQTVCPANPLPPPKSAEWSYQGRLLTSGGAPRQGLHDLRFTIYGQPAGGNALSAAQERRSVQLVQGLFSIDDLNFGDCLAVQAERWLEIEVRESGGGAYQVLQPRQKVTAAPLATGIVFPFNGRGDVAAPETLFTLMNDGSGSALRVLGVARSTEPMVAFIRTTIGPALVVSQQPQVGPPFEPSPDQVAAGGGGSFLAANSIIAPRNAPTPPITTSGLYGFSRHHAAVYGISDEGTGVYGKGVTQNSFAGEFDGRVLVHGDLIVEGKKQFRIDHPLDPEHRTLSHACVESDQLVNLYRGNARLDGTGRAVVELPDWFEALNVDVTYQLTPVGGPAPDLHVAREVKDRRFEIAGGAAGLKVSWVLTAVRRDAAALARPLIVEQLKPSAGAER